MKKIERGMILCAGLGTRLLPISEKTPKPIVPVLNIANLLFNLFLLKRAGITKIVINVHYLAEAMIDFLGDGSQWGVQITVSQEDPLLGTGGGVRKVMDFFQGETFVLSNCDFVTNIDLCPILEEHKRRKAVATMVLYKNERIQPFYSRVGVNAKGLLCQLPSCKTSEPSQTGIFTGIHVLEPEVLGHLPLEFCGINQILYPKLMKERPEETLGVFAQAGYWRDTGDHPAFWTTSMELLTETLETDSQVSQILRHLHFEKNAHGVWCAKNASSPKERLLPPAVVGKNIAWGRDVRIGPYTVIGDNCEIGEGVTIEESVVLPNSRVAPHQRVEKSIVFESTVLPTHRKSS